MRREFRRMFGDARLDYRGPLELIELDSRGNTRIAECLSNGKTLAHGLAARLSIAEGVAYALAPPTVPARRLYDFHSGGIVPQLPREHWQVSPGVGLLQQV